MSKLSIKPDIRRVRVSDIKPNPNNPREITQDAVTGLSKSLEAFGYVDLIVISKDDNMIVSGHQRFSILKQGGAEEVTALFVDLDPRDIEALAVTMNNREIMGDWTKEVVGLLDEIRQGRPELFSNLRLDSLRLDVSGLELSDSKMDQAKKDAAACAEVKCPRCGEVQS